MRKALLAVVAIIVLFVPVSCLVGVAAVITPGWSGEACPPLGGLAVNDVPERLEATTSDGTTIVLTKQQLEHAATIVTTGARTDGVGADGVIIALMAALTESKLRMLANVAAYPESGNYPNDGDAGDHDSLGLFQMRPSTGWGTVKELMDPTYQAKAFYGGPAGPNLGSPSGLLDIPGWRDMPPGAAAQAVEVSAHPDRYATFEPVARDIVSALTNDQSKQATNSSLTHAMRVVFPLPEGTWVRTSGYGFRIHPTTGARTLHTGVDYAAPAGTPILAVAEGRVVVAGPASGYGQLIVIEHIVDDETVASGYAHMPPDGVHVEEGDLVSAGQHIGDVGSTGNSTGPHLHFEIRLGGARSRPIDSESWLTRHKSAQLREPESTETGCRA